MYKPSPSNTMNGSWAEYSKTIFGDHKPSHVQYVETRRAFYAGMITVFMIMNKMDDEAEAMKILDGLARETSDFHEEILEEISSRGKA